MQKNTAQRGFFAKKLLTRCINCIIIISISFHFCRRNAGKNTKFEAFPRRSCKENAKGGDKT
jgi:hypothetical protein